MKVTDGASGPDLQHCRPPYCGTRRGTSSFQRVAPPHRRTLSGRLPFMARIARRLTVQRIEFRAAERHRHNVVGLLRPARTNVGVADLAPPVRPIQHSCAPHSMPGIRRPRRPARFESVLMLRAVRAARHQHTAALNPTFFTRPWHSTAAFLIQRTSGPVDRRVRHPDTPSGDRGDMCGNAGHRSW